AFVSSRSLAEYSRQALLAVLDEPDLANADSDRMAAFDGEPTVSGGVPGRAPGSVPGSVPGLQNEKQCE
ncbi:MAG TPA: hypothetical protein VF389_08610, partial [Woeseiaceae bacterium]